MPNNTPPNFITIDVLMESIEPMNEIIDICGEDIFVLRHDNDEDIWRLYFEASMKNNVSPNLNECIEHLMNVIIKIFIEHKMYNKKIKSVIFDLGFDSGEGNMKLVENIKSDHIKAMSELNIGMNITIYPVIGEKHRNNISG